MNYKYKNKLIYAFSILLLSFLLVVSLNGFASGEVEEFSNLEDKVNSIMAGNEENVSVFIETSEGTIGMNEMERISSASIIKVPILIEAIKQAEQGDLGWYDEVIVEESDIVRGSGILKDKEVPLQTTVQELADLMITVSDNTATNMIMERVGFDEVNWTCIQMGCVDTVLQTSIYTTMPQDRGPRNYASTKDMVTIMKEAMEGETLSPEGKEEYLRIMRSIEDARLSEYKDPVLHKDIQVGRKGGSTNSPRVLLHDVGFFTLGDDVVYAAVMTEDMLRADATALTAEIGAAIMDYMVETN